MLYFLGSLGDASTIVTMTHLGCVSSLVALLAVLVLEFIATVRERLPTQW